MVQTLKIHQPFFLHLQSIWEFGRAQDPAGWFAFFDEDGSGYLERQLLEKAKIDGEKLGQMVDTLTNHNGRIYKNTHWMLMHHRVLLFFIFGEKMSYMIPS